MPTSYLKNSWILKRLRFSEHLETQKRLHLKNTYYRCHRTVGTYAKIASSPRPKTFASDSVSSEQPFAASGLVQL